jgi:TRAP transporter 4TM/12TM fusion protein
MTVEPTPQPLHPLPLRGLGVLATILACAVPILAVSWILALPQRLGLLIYPEQIAGLMLGAAMTVIYLRDLYVLGAARRAIDIVLGLASLTLGLYWFVRFPVLSEGAFMHPTETLILGVAAVLLVMEALRRVVGWTLVIIFLVLFLYALYGNWVPGPLVGRPLPADDVFRFLGVDSTATLGQALQIAAFVVVVFVLFGGFLLAVGGGEFFTQLAMRVAGRGPGNTGKVAVVASALFGSVSGSAVSNVMSTGVMTIPLMKRSGFRNDQAGAIEAVASTGGQLMPPIMGAAAFLMAEILQIPYREIVLAAILPALLYYLSILVQIDFMARRDRVASFNDFERDRIVDVLRKGWIPVLAFAVLLYLIFQVRMRAEAAAVWTIGAILALGLAAWLFKAREGQLAPGRMLATLARTGSATCDILLITAAAGMIIGLLTTTGLGFALSLYLLDFGGQNLFALLVVTALVGIVLGLGLPTTGVYLLMASLAAPPLIQLGIPPLAAHMFVFYYGMLSMITPPIALAAFAAASIAEAPQLKTGVQSFRFGWIAYLLPFLFIYKPGLLMSGDFIDIVYVFASSVVAIVLVVGGMLGHGLRPLSNLSRLVWLPLGILTIAPISEYSHALEYAVSAAGLVIVLAHVAMARAAAPALARG